MKDIGMSALTRLSNKGKEKNPVTNMKKLFILLLTIAFLFSFAACQAETEKPEAVRFVVETDFEYHFEENGHYRDVVMPRVADSVVNGGEINEQLLSRYNTLEELQESEGWTNSPEDSFKIYFTVSRKAGICSLDLLYEKLKENGNGADPDDYYINTVESYYYDENAGRVLSQGEYLAALGYTEDDILKIFNEEYGEKYSNRTYDFSHIIFWFDEESELRFSTYYIDQMDSNTADFALVINGGKYQTGALAPPISPFGEAVKSEEKFYDEVWAGSWWAEEYYDGAYVLYSLNKETGGKYPFHVEITSPNREDGFKAYTYRGAEVGDTREQILALYPEINPEEEKQRHGTDDQINLEGNGGYSYLEFHFKGNIVVKLTAGTLID